MHTLVYLAHNECPPPATAVSPSKYISPCGDGGSATKVVVRTAKNSIRRREKERSSFKHRGFMLLKIQFFLFSMGWQWNNRSCCVYFTGSNRCSGKVLAFRFFRHHNLPSSRKGRGGGVSKWVLREILTILKAFWWAWRVQLK